MKYWILLSLIFVCTYQPARAADPVAEVSYEQSCINDPKFCNKLKTFGGLGSVIQPTPTMLKMIEVMADPIIDWSKKFGVDPRAVAGSILTEHSLNVDIQRNVKTMLVDNGTLGDDALKSHNLSFGPGQINVTAAESAEQYIAKLENRAPRSDGEIMERLRSVDGAAEYGAAIVRQAQDFYKDRGVDISKRPDILATLYNLGRLETKAANIDKNVAPKPNYFGAFVANNLKKVEDAIGWSPSRGRFRSSSTEVTGGGDMGTLSRPVNFSAAPPDCFSSGGYSDRNREQEDEAKRLRNSIRRFSEVKVEGTKFKEIGRGVDCQMKDYVLVQSDKGNLGWASRAEFQYAYEPPGTNSKGQFPIISPTGDYIPLPEDPVDNKTLRCSVSNPKCDAEILKAAGADKFIEGKEDKSGMKYHPIGRKNPEDPVNWKKANSDEDRTAYGATDPFSCKDGDYDTLRDLVNGVVRPRTVPMGYVEIKSDEMNAMREKLKDKLKQADAYRFNSPDGSSHPLSSALGLVMSALNGCDRSYSSKSICIVQGKDAVDKLLNSDLNSKIKLSEFKAIQKSIGNVDFLRFDPTPRTSMRDDSLEDRDTQKDKDAWLKQLKESIARNKSRVQPAIDKAKDECGKISAEFPDLKPKIDEALADPPEEAFVSLYADPYENVSTYCRQIGYLVDNKKTGATPWKNNGENCMIGQSNGYGASYRFSFDMLAAMDISDSDYDDLLNPALSFIKDASRRATTIGKSKMAQFSAPTDDPKKNLIEAKREKLAGCNYDEEATVKILENLKQSDCISNIAVGDSNLVNAVTVPKSLNLVKMPQLPPDRIGIVIRGTCGESSFGGFKWRPW